MELSRVYEDPYGGGRTLAADLSPVMRPRWSCSPGSINHKTVGVPSDGIGQIIGRRGDTADAPGQKGAEVREGPHAELREMGQQGESCESRHQTERYAARATHGSYITCPGD